MHTKENWFLFSASRCNELLVLYSHSMQSRVYATVGHLSVRPYVPSVRRTRLLRVCCCTSGGPAVSSSSAAARRAAANAGSATLSADVGS